MGAHQQAHSNGSRALLSRGVTKLMTLGTATTFAMVTAATSTAGSAIPQASGVSAIADSPQQPPITVAQGLPSPATSAATTAQAAPTADVAAATSALKVSTSKSSQSVAMSNEPAPAPTVGPSKAAAEKLPTVGATTPRPNAPVDSAHSLAIAPDSLPAELQGAMETPIFGDTMTSAGLVVEAISEDPTREDSQPVRHVALQTDRGMEVVPPAAAAQLAGGQMAVLRHDGLSLAGARDASVVMQVKSNEETALASASTAGGSVTHDVTIALAVPAGFETDDATERQVADMINNQVSRFWERQTDGALKFQVVATHNWVQFNESCQYNPFGVWQEVASKIGWRGNSSDHLLLYLPRSAQNTCGVGLGTVGAASWGALAWVSGPPRADVAAHEMGHNLGLGHANSLVCPNVSDGAWDPAAGNYRDSCRVQAYGDWNDVMGVSHGALGSLSSLNQYRLGISTSSHASVSRTQTVRLAAAHRHDGTRGAIVRGPNGVDYYVEYRSDVEENAWLTSRGINPGVQIRTVGREKSTESVILDATPTGSSADREVSLTPGTSVRLSDGAVTVALMGGANADGGEVSITFAGDEPAPEQPPASSPVKSATTIQPTESQSTQSGPSIKTSSRING